MDRRLKKSQDKKLAGVCGGIAEFFGIDPTLVRLGYACLTIFSIGFPGILLYAICMFIFPQADNNSNYIK